MNDLFDKMGEEQASRVAYLIAGYVRQTLSEEEHDELDEWITASYDNQRLFEELTDPETIQSGLHKMKSIDVDAAREKVWSKIRFNDADKDKGEVKAKISKGKRWLPYSIAASLIIVAGVVLFFMTNKRTKTKDPIAAKTESIKPGGNYATLTLANGKKINLFDVKNGLIDSTNGNEVLKTADGQISYESSLHLSSAFHVLTTPVGGQYQVKLPDGTRVWLNSSSSLKYPVAFDEKERVVELSGEGYFEVSSLSSPGLKATPSKGGQEKVPFVVKVGDMKVEVRGTHFNVNAYEDEPSINTTLLEGKIVIGSETSDVTNEIKPGEQARVSKNKLEIVVYADPYQTVAWKDGVFKFQDAPIEDIMRQVARWYGVEIVYEEKTTHHFNATIDRKEPLNKLLDFLEGTNEVHFRVEGRKVYVRK